MIFQLLQVLQLINLIGTPEMLRPYRIKKGRSVMLSWLSKNQGKKDMLESKTVGWLGNASASDDKIPDILK